MMTETETDARSLKTMTVKDACKRLGVSYTTGRLAVRRGDIPSIRIGGAMRVPEALLARKMGLGA